MGVVGGNGEAGMRFGEPQGGAPKPDRQPAVREGGGGVRGRMVSSYLAGQFAGAQAVLHGQRLGHVGHRLVELLQVALVLHLHVDTGADTESPHA